MTMTGLMLNPTQADSRKSALHPRPRARTGASPLTRPTRLQRILNGWMAAANTYRERQAALLASYRAGGRKLNNKRIYRGPIDDALERAVRLRQRRRRKQSLN
jgi:hypothetical protein